MKTSVSAFIVGLIFSLGLGISKMTQPKKVIGFLDVFDQWDPTLLFVMVGAIGVHFFSYKLILKRSSPLFSKNWYIPAQDSVSTPLLLGSFLFGIGWGLAGYCPAPAVTSIVSLDQRVLVFVVSMIAGMQLFRFLDNKLKILK